MKSSLCQRRPQNCEASFYINMTEFPHATVLRLFYIQNCFATVLHPEQLLILPLQLPACCAWSCHLNQVTILTSSLTSCLPGLDPNTGDYIPSYLKVLRKYSLMELLLIVDAFVLVMHFVDTPDNVLSLVKVCIRAKRPTVPELVPVSVA